MFCSFPYCHNSPGCLLADSGDVCRVVRQNKALAGCNDHYFYDIDSAEDCWHLCVIHTAFVCNSGEYFDDSSDEDYRECRLSVKTSYTAPGPYNSYSATVLIERCEP